METTPAGKIKTTLNLDAAVKEKIEALARKKVIQSQTEFINGALRKSLADMDKEANLRRLKHRLHHLEGYTSGITALDARGKVRAESLDSA